MKILMSKTEDFLKRLRWTAFFFENMDPEKKGRFGFKTPHNPPQDDDFIEFENDMYEMINQSSSKTPRPNCNTNWKMIQRRSENQRKLQSQQIKQKPLSTKQDTKKRTRNINEASARLAHEHEIDDRVQQFTTLETTQKLVPLNLSR